MPDTDLFRTGDRVRTTHADPPHHTRLPLYARGAPGTIVEREGDFPLADDRAQGRTTPPQPVYSVRFTAQDLFGEGDHDITLALWESYLRAES